jgi:hypothetical protein
MDMAERREFRNSAIVFLVIFVLFILLVPHGQLIGVSGSIGVSGPADPP